MSALSTVGRTIGFDMEWNFGLGDEPTAVVQLATADRVLILHVASMRMLPPSLVEVLLDPSIRKVGVAVQQDMAKLRRDFGVAAVGALELSRVAMKLDEDQWHGRRGLISLQALTRTYLGRDLDKGPTRLSTWSRVPLSSEQLEYAASDVYSSLEILHALLCRAHERAPFSEADAVRVFEAAAQRQPRPRAVPTSQPRAHQRAWHAWAAGERLPAVAASRNIQVQTAALYLIRAVLELPATSLPRYSALWYRAREELAAPEVRMATVRHGLALARRGVYTYSELQDMVRQIRGDG